MNFNELNLPDYVMQALSDMGFENPTEIQYKAIPKIIAGKDIIGKSQTGSGKTFAYGIPAIMSIDTDIRYPQVLVVCPTRELASQVCDELRKVTVLKPGCRIVPIFGGSNMDRQIDALKKGARIVVGTPGRLMDHLRRRTLKLHELKMVVLDEADEMLDMGFREDIETILKSTNNTHQTVMFSATMPKEIMALTKLYMVEPELVEITEPESQLVIHQYFVNVGLKDKSLALCELISKFNPTVSIVFCNTRRMVDSLTEDLNREHINALGLHGNMRQNERHKVMQEVKRVANLEVKKGNIVLVATDVAARGIDINGVDAVFNYDLPNNHDYYTHRIGRTGRAGKVGYSYSIINTRPQLDAVKELIRSTNKDIEEYVVSCSKSVGSSMARDNKDSHPSGNRSRDSRPSRAPNGFNRTRREDRPSQQNDNRNSSRPQNAQSRPNARAKDAYPVKRSTPPFQNWDIADDEEYRSEYNRKGSRFGHNQSGRKDNRGSAPRSSRPNDRLNNGRLTKTEENKGQSKSNNRDAKPTHQSRPELKDNQSIGKKINEKSFDNKKSFAKPYDKTRTTSPRQNNSRTSDFNPKDNRPSRDQKAKPNTDNAKPNKKPFFKTKFQNAGEQKPKRSFWGKKTTK